MKKYDSFNMHFILIIWFYFVYLLLLLNLLVLEFSSLLVACCFDLVYYWPNTWFMLGFSID